MNVPPSGQFELAVQLASDSSIPCVIEMNLIKQRVKLERHGTVRHASTTFYQKFSIKNSLAPWENFKGEISTRFLKAPAANKRPVQRGTVIRKVWCYLKHGRIIEND